MRLGVFDFSTLVTVATSEFGCLADLVLGQNLNAGPHNRTQWLNTNAFAQPPIATTIGETNFAVLGGGPQQARGPSFSNLDSSIFKNFKFTETISMQFRAEAFNTTNTPQLGQPTNLNFTNTAGGFSAITSTRAPSRRLQLAQKLFF